MYTLFHVHFYNSILVVNYLETYKLFVLEIYMVTVVKSLFVYTLLYVTTSSGSH